MSNVKRCGAAVAAKARSVFHRHAFARPDRTVANGMRPHVLRLPQPAACERPIERRLERVEIAVRSVPFDAKFAELRQGTFFRFRINEITGSVAEQLVPHAADITRLPDKMVR